MSSKSEGVKDVLEWLEVRCKALKADFEDSKGDIYNDGFFADRSEARFHEALSIKVSVEKYMKKLKHQGE